VKLALSHVLIVANGMAAIVLIAVRSRIFAGKQIWKTSSWPDGICRDE
jgi:hypothetical protein